jgi:hypothetical protein
LLVLSGCKSDKNEQQLVEKDSVERQVQVAQEVESKEPWTEQQLLEPRDLALMLQNESDSLVIYSLGAGGIIPGSKDTGPSGEKKSLQKLKKELEELPKNSDIVLYCGCCPFENCPNVRPAFSLLNEMGFTNHQLLNLRDNIKVDWIDRGFPTVQ